MMSSGSSIPAPKAGFSMIEVTLALGIVSFAMVTLLALIPVGLNSFKRAMNLTVEAQIVQSIASAVSLEKFSGLSQTSYYFDNQGTPTTASGTDLVYTAALSFQKDLSSVASASLDTTSGAVAQIDIYQNKSSASTPHTYTIIVANNGQ